MGCHWFSILILWVEIGISSIMLGILPWMKLINEWEFLFCNFVGDNWWANIFSKCLAFLTDGFQIELVVGSWRVWNIGALCIIAWFLFLGYWDRAMVMLGGWLIWSYLRKWDLWWSWVRQITLTRTVTLSLPYLTHEETFAGHIKKCIMLMGIFETMYHTIFVSKWGIMMMCTCVSKRSEQSLFSFGKFNGFKSCESF